MAEYTARDLRVAREWCDKHVGASLDGCFENLYPLLATALAAERRRTLRGMARWAKREAAYYHDGSLVGSMLRYDVAAEASRRARGSK